MSRKNIQSKDVWLRERVKQCAIASRLITFRDHEWRVDNRLSNKPTNTVIFCGDELGRLSIEYDSEHGDSNHEGKQPRKGYTEGGKRVVGELMNWQLKRSFFIDDLNKWNAVEDSSTVKASRILRVGRECECNSSSDDKDILVEHWQKIRTLNCLLVATSVPKSKDIIPQHYWTH